MKSAIEMKAMHTRMLSPSFYVLPLGTSGGLEEDNLSSYLLASINDYIPSSTYIALDCGTIRHGIEMAIEHKSLPEDTDIDVFIRNQIKAYLISHGHLDHVSGFLLNNPNDKAEKVIVGLNETIQIIQDHYYNNKAWINFGPTGLKTYNYQILDPFSSTSVPIPGTDFDVRIFRLCHICPFLSSAFLISRRTYSSEAVLYLGDTGPDDVEKMTLPNNRTYSPGYLKQLWQAITPLIAERKLKAIFIEVSYPNGRSSNQLFGHLTPEWLLKELNVLRRYHKINNVKIIITHIKPEKNARNTIIKELNSATSLGFNFVFPTQGRGIWL
ncbi:unnamed protein product [Rotaria sp. Silwood1]|nr:unnamed protein product [Rotaria sp. Silwood1]CAF1651339.1 unnamed protein product [Rotaria sp. Silwood1]CAF3823119.1 unnamed protein product [Rotaria sp. Silwood1]CAF4943207.1 unnamed protein product [Rotaria sp. Silwood1]CAF4953984.1 unnamed protein product [Rotaria sp. Silwood1]